jgi:hypothetical protein
MKVTIAKTMSALSLVIAIGVMQGPAQTSTPSGARQTAGAEKTLTGVVSDAMCGKTHMAKDKSAAECTRMCVQQGQKYALVVGEKVYTMEGQEAELNRMAGQWVTVRGTLTGDTINVTSVAPAKKRPS